MKNCEEILETAFLKLMIADRGLLEREYQEGERYSFEERENKRCFFIDILRSRSLFDKLSSKDLEIMTSEVDTLKDEVFYDTQMQYESIPILLWATNMITFSRYDGKLCEIDFHPLLGKFGTDQFQIGKICVLLEQESIASQRERAMLWHWRSIEGVANKFLSKNDIVTSVIRIFGKEFEDYLDMIPLSKRKPRDFLVGKDKFNELDEDTGKILLIQSKWRHHALEWILSDSKWEETDTST